MSDEELCLVCGASWQCEHAAAPHWLSGGGQAGQGQGFPAPERLPEGEASAAGGGGAVELLERAAAMERFAGNIASLFVQRRLTDD